MKRSNALTLALLFVFALLILSGCTSWGPWIEGEIIGPLGPGEETTVSTMSGGMLFKYVELVEGENGIGVRMGEDGQVFYLGDVCYESQGLVSFGHPVQEKIRLEKIEDGKATFKYFYRLPE